jgi:RimJ/RimL family protein N-acetyltransferase
VRLFRRRGAILDPDLRVETERLLLVPCSLEAARAAPIDTERVGELYSVGIPEGWPSDELREAFPAFVRQLERDPRSFGWGNWLVIEPREEMLVGDVGFKGRPDRTGTVEIGYGIAPAYRRRGYALEAARGLLKWAFSHSEVKRVIAECHKDNTPSIRVLEGVGVVRLKPVGDMLRWELWRPS